MFLVLSIDCIWGLTILNKFGIIAAISNSSDVFQSPPHYFPNVNFVSPDASKLVPQTQDPTFLVLLCRPSSLCAFYPGQFLLLRLQIHSVFPVQSLPSIRPSAFHLVDNSSLLWGFCLDSLCSSHIQSFPGSLTTWCYCFNAFIANASSGGISQKLLGNWFFFLHCGSHFPDSLYVW